MVITAPAPRSPPLTFLPTITIARLNWVRGEKHTTLQIFLYLQIQSTTHPIATALFFYAINYTIPPLCRRGTKITKTMVKNVMVAMVGVAIKRGRSMKETISVLDCWILVCRPCISNISTIIVLLCRVHHWEQPLQHFRHGIRLGTPILCMATFHICFIHRVGMVLLCFCLLRSINLNPAFQNRMKSSKKF